VNDGELNMRRRLIGNELAFAASALVVVLYISFCWTRSVAAQEPTAKRIEHADQEPQNWLTFFGNYRAWSYSPLDQITRENVKQLVPVWAFPTGGQNGLQAAPLVVDGVLYIENHQNHVFAVDAATGRPLWSYAYEASKASSSEPALGTRGLAIGYGLVYMGTRDNHLVAIDAKTGKEVWNAQVPDTTRCCGITAAPLLVKDKVITGVVGGEWAHRGYLTAFDAKTGKMVWRFYTYRHLANPVRKPGRGTHGKPAAAPLGSPAHMIRN
jgi:glucose dehydrogenase